MKLTIVVIIFLLVTLPVYLHYAMAQQKTYAVYVEPLPDYATSYASNTIYDATTAWQNANPEIKFLYTPSPQQADLTVQWIRDYGAYNGRAGEYTGNGIIEIGLGDSNCGGTWQPYSTNTVTHIAEHEIGHFLGLGHSPDPNNVMYAITNIQYGTVKWTKNLDTGYAWFVPICTTKNVSSFAYSVSLNNQNEAFDVYFVPSSDELNKYIDNQQFQYYQGNGCSGTNWVSYNAVCQRVAQGSGLLIATHGHILINHLITITAKLTEQEYMGILSTIPIISEPSGSSSSSQQPTSQITPTPATTQNISWVLILVIFGIIGGGLTAMRYASKR